MSKSDIEFKLIDISSSYDPESDYFTLQADMKPLSYENIFILSSKIISYQDDVLINTSDNTLMLFENEDDVCGIYDGISENGNNNPNKFDVIYKIFSLIEKNTLNLKLPGPPELSRKGGSFIVHQPERNFIGSNKWKYGSISIESIVIRQLEDSYEMYFNLENKDFLYSIPVIEIKGKNWTQRTEPILAENSKFQISLNIYEEIDSLDFDFKFMCFEVTESDRLIDQIVPEPDIEETNDDNEEFVEDVKEIIVGNTYDVSAYNRSSFTEITQFENKKTKKTLNVETMWKNGNFTITIKNDEEREELQNCIGDDGDVFDYERYEEIELEDYFDDKGSEFIYWNSCGIDEKEQEQLEDEFQNSSSHLRQDFLEEKGFDISFTNYQIHGGLVVNQVGEGASEKDNNKDVLEDNQLEQLIENFMDECQEDLFLLEQPFRDHVLSKFTPEAPKISLGFGLYPLGSNTFGVSVNMFLNDYDTDEPISYKDIEILNPENVSDENKVDVFFERVQDATYDDFYNVAENGFKGLKLPKDIADAFVNSNEAKYEYVETKVYWNDDEIDVKVGLPEDKNETLTQNTQKTKEAKSQLKFILNELSSEIDEESYLNFSCDFEVQNLKEKKSFCEYQLILLQAEDKNTPLSNCKVIYNERSKKCLLNQSENQLYLSSSVKINKTLIPNKFILKYRFFDEIGSFRFTPKLPNKKGNVVYNLHEKSDDGQNKWSSNGVEINSMRIKNDDGYFDFNYNLTCNKLDFFGLNFSWMTPSYPDESHDFEILQHEYTTLGGGFESSKDVEVLCRIFQASEWKEFSDDNLFTTDS